MAQDFVSTVGGASIPEKGGGFYYGKIAGRKNGKLTVSVPMLGIVSQPCDFLNAYVNDLYTVGERVVVGFLEHRKENLIVFGRVNHRDRVFPTYAQYLALVERVSALELTVESLQAQITAQSLVIAQKANATHSH